MQPLPGPDPYDVGDFRQGTEISRWALARYLVGQAIGSYLRVSLLIAAAVLVAVAVVVAWFGPEWLGVLIGIVALGVLLMRALLGAVLRRFAALGGTGPDERQLRALVGQTRGDVRRELRRIGVAHSPLTAPLLGFRLLGRRRADILQRMRSFDVERVVPPSRLDELHMLLSAARRDVPPTG